MRLLLRNPSLRKALLDLPGKPMAESCALRIPTASHANRNGPLQAIA